MKVERLCIAVLASLAASAVIAQSQSPAPRQGPGVQAPQDARYPETIARCKSPPPAPQQAGGGPPARPPGPGVTTPREYTVTAIPGVVEGGQRWQVVWQVNGNNADGIVGTDDGGLLIAQNDNSAVVKLDRNGNASTAYQGTNTGGALSLNRKGELFVAERGLNPAVLQLAPQRRTLANRFQGDTLDCLGGVMNDVTADSRGGVYFTMGGLFYAAPDGTVTRYGQNLRTNGVILSADEKTLYVTNGDTVVAFDVQANGALANQRDFAKLPEAGGDGMTIDSEGRLYVTAMSGVHVFDRGGKFLGTIPTPIGAISTAFSGPDKKTLHVVVFFRGENRSAQILAMPMIAQGYQGRAK